MAKLCWAEWAQIFTVYASMVYGFLAVCNMVFDEDEVQMSGIAFLMSLVLLFLESPPQALNKYFASYNNCFARMIVIIGCAIPGFFHAAPAAGSICLIVGAIMYGWGGFSGEAAGPKNASHSL
eukprot:TRINITY_DN14290_c0_g1_i1.p1 TRINITY_DN14290_c0_g1~~TRINITY_DN14290_c0_g1_i1.p1  ORF type:complete len:123 (+),score=23.44 TRINITY_DN14290_c0_g1_i1:54-422(+)